MDVLYVEWFDVPLEAIAHDVLLKQRRDKELAGKEEDFWRSPTPPTVTTEEAEAVISKSLVRKKDKTVKPRDEAARKQRRARYEELKAQQASQGSSPAGAAQPATASSAGSGEVLIPGGAFAMGNRDGGKVTVGRFYIDITEVTVDAYAACVNAGQCSAPGGRERWQNEGCNWGESGKENHPINCVDWDQASAYCKWKGKRLPTEEEWEWAARGGSRATEFPWGNEEPSTQLCWSGDRRRKGTCAVGSFPGGNSPFGIMDLAGNVQEWTSTIWYDGVNAPDKRVRTIRGGAFANAVSNSVRAEYSHGNAMSNRGKGCGFRCARTAS